MDTVATLALISYPVLLAILAFFMKRWIDRLEKLVEKLVENETACRLNLTSTYQTKTDSEVDSTRQWEKIDDLGNRMTRAETRLEAVGK